MKSVSSAIIFKSEWQQAIFQCEEYSYSEARPFQDEQKNRIGYDSSNCTLCRRGFCAADPIDFIKKRCGVLCKVPKNHPSALRNDKKYVTKRSTIIIKVT